MIKGVRKKRLSKSTWTIVILSVIVVAFLVYFIMGWYNGSQLVKLNRAATYGAQVRDVQLFAQSNKCGVVVVSALDTNGKQLQKALMEVSPSCINAYQETLNKLVAAAQQQTESNQQQTESK